MPISMIHRTPRTGHLQLQSRVELYLGVIKISHVDIDRVGFSSKEWRSRLIK
jgi:hypothetical protein